jgi:hypothetical protein
LRYRRALCGRPHRRAVCYRDGGTLGHRRSRRGRRARSRSARRTG